MNDAPPSNPQSTPTVMLWIGRVISALPVLLLLFSASMKFTKSAELVEGFKKFGYADDVALPLGVVELLCTALYAVPQTAVLGAILLTGYLGGATATHLRIGDPWFPPIILGVALWVGLYLRDARIRELAPWRTLR